MPLPYSFGPPTTTATGTNLDQNFSALASLVPIPCTASGTNSITLTPFTANVPTVTALANYSLFVAIAAATNTGAVTVTVGSFTALPVYRDSVTGPVALTSGQIVANNAIYLVYDSALNSGSGGFHLLNVPLTSGTVTETGSPTIGQIAQWSSGTSITGVGVQGTGNVVLATNPTISGPTITTGVGTFTTLITTGYTVATLPAASSGLKGARAHITDASISTASVGGAITGGGSNVMPVFCNGTAWVYG